MRLYLIFNKQICGDIKMRNLSLMNFGLELKEKTSKNPIYLKESYALIKRFTKNTYSII